MPFFRRQDTLYVPTVLCVINIIKIFWNSANFFYFFRYWNNMKRTILKVIIILRVNFFVLGKTTIVLHKIVLVYAFPRAWNSLDQGESLAFQITSQKIIFYIRNNLTYCWRGKFSGKPVTPLYLKSSIPRANFPM